MWTFVVVFTAPEVEDPLLGTSIVRWRRRCLGLQGAMESLEPAVLLRLPRRDDLDANAELEEPDRQLRQSGGPCRGKRRAPVRADRERQAELDECGVEDRRRRGTVIPRRLSTLLITLALGTGTPGFCSTRRWRSFRGPHAGQFLRASTMMSSISTGSAVGEVLGRREGSLSAHRTSDRARPCSPLPPPLHSSVAPIRGPASYAPSWHPSRSRAYDDGRRAL